MDLRSSGEIVGACWKISRVLRRRTDYAIPDAEVSFGTMEPAWIDLALIALLVVLLLYQELWHGFLWIVHKAAKQ